MAFFKPALLLRKAYLKSIDGILAVFHEPLDYAILPNRGPGVVGRTCRACLRLSNEGVRRAQVRPRMRLRVGALVLLSVSSSIATM